jgi:hypothetical protein
LTSQDEHGTVVEDLGARDVESVWVDIGAEGRRVDVYSA